MKRKYPYPDGEEAFQRVLEIMRNITDEEWAERLERIDREHEEAEAEYRLLMAKSQGVPAANGSVSPHAAEAAQTPVIRRRPKRAQRAAAA